MPKGPNGETRLSDAIVCYADILGFRQMSEHALKSGEGDKFLRRIKRPLATAYGRVHERSTIGDREPPIFDMKVFTDNIVLAYPLRNVTRNGGEPELATLLDLLADVQASLAADGFFLRGAITKGAHYQDRDIAYGDALLEAVDLDKSGMPPRLVIGPSLEPLLSKQLSFYGGMPPPHHRHLLEDPRDERLFINYLMGAFDFFPPGPINHNLLMAHSTAISDNLEEHQSNSRVWPKYAWLATYHNYICNTVAELFSVPHEEADIEEMAYGQEAERLLDYLVPFNVELLPRPLDAERLQKRVEDAGLSPL